MIRNRTKILFLFFSIVVVSLVAASQIKEKLVVEPLSTEIMEVQSSGSKYLFAYTTRQKNTLNFELHVVDEDYNDFILDKAYDDTDEQISLAHWKSSDVLVYAKGKRSDEASAWDIYEVDLNVSRDRKKLFKIDAYLGNLLIQESGKVWWAERHEDLNQFYIKYSPSFDLSRSRTVMSLPIPPGRGPGFQDWRRFIPSPDGKYIIWGQSLSMPSSERENIIIFNNNGDPIHKIPSTTISPAKYFRGEPRFINDSRFVFYEENIATKEERYVLFDISSLSESNYSNFKSYVYDIDEGSNRLLYNTYTYGGPNYWTVSYVDLNTGVDSLIRGNTAFSQWLKNGLIASITVEKADPPGYFDWDEAAFVIIDPQTGEIVRTIADLSQQYVDPIIVQSN